MNRLRTTFAPYWQSIQHALFPQLEHVLGPLTRKQQQLVQTLEIIRIEQWIPRLRNPEDLERQIRRKLNTESGMLNTGSGEAEHGIRSS